MHILVTGEQGVGKTTLINRLLPRAHCPIYGFVTEKGDSDPPGRFSIYMHPATGDKSFSAQNTVGSCTGGRAKGHTEVFDSLGAQLLTDIPANSIVLMDELGFMETQALKFRRKVLSVMDDSYFVIAAVKLKDTEFLNQVRSHKNALVYEINTANRSSLYERILTDLRLRDPDSPFLPR